MNFGKNLRSSALKLQEEDETSYYGSNLSFSDDDDNDSEYQSNSKRINSSEGNNKITRKPTRVPNLKIQNRNALLARENRKRKKEMMENLENKVTGLYAENRSLHKIIKSKDSRIDKLVKEIQYLKSVLSNHTEIVSILKSLSHLPTVTKSGIDKNKDAVSIDSSKSSSDTLSCNTFDDGSKKTRDPFLASYIDDSFLTDLEAESIATDWDEILRNPLSSMTDFSDIPKLDQTTSGLSPFSDVSTHSEHNYSHYNNQFEEKGNNDSLPGICLHINTGRVSLEYCSVCHLNAKNSWENN